MHHPLDADARNAPAAPRQGARHATWVLVIVALALLTVGVAPPSPAVEGASLADPRAIGAPDVAVLAAGARDSALGLQADTTLTWHTFLGTPTGDYGNAVAADGSGNVYVVGSSQATWGNPVRPYRADYDAFVAKLDSSGSLVWNTFLGSTQGDYGFAVAVDSDGNVYAGGYSGSTWGSPVRGYSGLHDAFAVKLDPSGSLVWNTFLGCTASDAGEALAVDGAGNVYMAGSSNYSWGTPVRANQGSDAFAAKLDSGGSLVWNTFLGCTANDTGNSVALDSDGNVFVAGRSMATWGSPVRGHSGDYDAFAAKLSPIGTLLWNTFLGSDDIDSGMAVAADASGNALAVGRSGTTWGTPIRAHAGDYDAFAAKLDTAGSLIWSTFLGCSAYDDGWAVAADGGGNAYVTGWSVATWGNPDHAHAGGYDAFVAVLNPSGALIWSTFVGGSSTEWGHGVALDGAANVCVGGTSRGTWGSPLRAFSGDRDAFVAKLDAVAISTPTPTASATLTPTATATPTPTPTTTPAIEPGDCNADTDVDAGDLSALILEVFDGDGTDPSNVPGGTFAGDVIGCNANEDATVDAGDLSCTILIIFNGPGACGP